jgi:hypothetical protein
MAGDRDHFEAQRLLEVVTSQIWDVTPARGAFWGGVVIVALAGLQLLVLWLAFFMNAERVPHAMFASMVGLLLAFIVVGFVLPSLKSFKLAGGIEAEVQQATPAAPSGPKVMLGLGASVPGTNKPA